MSDLEKTREAIRRLKGRDRVGVAGQVAGTGMAAAGGAAASGAIASFFGATTVFGSSALAPLLGGVFVASTPVGWVIGSAAAAGAVGYGISKLCVSGGVQDQRRDQLVRELEARLQKSENNEPADHSLSALYQTLKEVVTDSALLEQADSILELVDAGKLNPELAIRRLKAVIEVEQSAP